MISTIYSPKIGFHFWPSAGPLFPAYLAYFTFNFTLGHWILFQNRLQKKYIIPIGTLIAFLGGSANFFLWYKIEVPPYPNILVGIYAIFIFFAVTKNELLGTKFTLTKIASFIATMTLFTSTYLLGIVLPYQSFISSQIDIGFLGVTIAFGGLVVGQYFRTVQDYLMDRAYASLSKGARLDIILKAASEKLIFSQSHEDVLNAILTVQSELQISESFALIKQDEQKEFDYFKVKHVKKNTGKTKIEDTSISLEKIKSYASHSDLIKHCASIEGRVVKYDEIPLVIQHELDALNIPPKSLFLLIHSFGKLQAIFILGPKLSGVRYTEQDVSLFDAILNHAITVFERISQTRKITRLNTELNSQNHFLETRVAEDVHKVQLALAAAQELSKKAQLSTLTMGIAHEIRNPISAMQGKAAHLKEQLGGKMNLAVELGEDLFPFSPVVTKARLGLVLQQDLELTDIVWNGLIKKNYVNDTGEINEKKFRPYSTLFSLQLPELAEPHRHAISAYLVRTYFDSKIVVSLDVFDEEAQRVERICNNMLKYGMASKGIPKEAFTSIVGQESALLWEELVEQGYLDNYGMILNKFDTRDLENPLELSPHFKEKTTLISQIINKAEQAKKQTINLNTSLVELYNLFDGKFKRNGISFTYELDDTIPDILGHFDDLKQAFMNIINNAFHALMSKPDGPKDIIVRTKIATDQDTPMVEVQIQDTGCGIPKDILPRIMDPFFSTKTVTGGQNVGLGLSIVSQTIDRFGGKILIETEEGVGTMFRILFPVS